MLVEGNHVGEITQWLLLYGLGSHTVLLTAPRLRKPGRFGSIGGFGWEEALSGPTAPPSRDRDARVCFLLLPNHRWLSSPAGRAWRRWGICSILDLFPVCDESKGGGTLFWFKWCSHRLVEGFLAQLVWSSGTSWAFLGAGPSDPQVGMYRAVSDSELVALCLFIFVKKPPFSIAHGQVGREQPAGGEGYGCETCSAPRCSKSSNRCSKTVQKFQ